METISITGAFLLSIWGIPAYAQELPTAPPINITVSTSSELWIRMRIHAYSDFYEVSEETMNYIVKHESNYNCKAIGDYGNSHGCVQIHQPSHPDITTEQAYDIDFSLDFLAKNLKAGKCKMWTTCPL